MHLPPYISAYVPLLLCSLCASTAFHFRPYISSCIGSSVPLPFRDIAVLCFLPLYLLPSWTLHLYDSAPLYVNAHVLLCHYGLVICGFVSLCLQASEPLNSGSLCETTTAVVKIGRLVLESDSTKWLLNLVSHKRLSGFCERWLAIELSDVRILQWQQTSHIATRHKRVLCGLEWSVGSSFTVCASKEGHASLNYTKYCLDHGP